jgi:hypothetical protein
MIIDMYICYMGYQEESIMKATMSMADRIAALPPGTVIGDGLNEISTELPDNDMNIPPHLIAQAANVTVQPQVEIIAGETPTEPRKMPEKDITMQELIEAGVPVSVAEQLTPESIKQICRLGKNHYTRDWNRKKKNPANKVSELEAHALAVQSGLDIHKQQATQPIHGTASGAPASKSEQYTETKKVKNMTVKEIENRIDSLEDNVGKILAAVTAMGAHQVTPQAFSVAPATNSVPVVTVPAFAVTKAAPSAQMVYQRIYQYDATKGKNKGEKVTTAASSIRGFPLNATDFYANLPYVMNPARVHTLAEDFRNLGAAEVQRRLFELEAGLNARKL